MAYINEVQIKAAGANIFSPYLIEPTLYIKPTLNNSAYSYSDNSSSLKNFELVNGVAIQVEFAATNPANATLNINNKGAKPIYYENSTVSAGLLSANRIYTLVYDSANSGRWYIVGDIDTDTTYTNGTGLNLTGTTFSVKYGNTEGTAAQGNDSRLSDARTPLSHTHGNINNNGTIGTANAARAVVTNASNQITIDNFEQDSPSVPTSGTTTALEFIDTISQSSTGKITATKKGITLVSKDNAGLAPKGAQVNTQSQNTKFLREDGSWAVPSYTENTDHDTKVTQTGVTDNQELSILLKNTNDTTDETTSIKYSKTTDKLVTVNPSTGKISAAVGNFSGNMTIGGNLNFSTASRIDWDSGTVRQRLLITDDSTTDTAVFTFQQSTNTGSAYTNLFTIKDNGTVVATTFSGSGANLTSLPAGQLTGTIDAARLPTSGVTAGSYGPSAAVTGSNNTTMDVPYITVDTYGRITAISNKVYTAVNTWRGIQNNLTSSTNTTESLSAKQGYLLANGSARDNTKVLKSGDTMTGTLNLTPASGEGGEIHLNASTAQTAQAGIVLDQQSSTFRIFGIASADGTSKTGTGTPLVIDPYAKTITGGYTLTGHASQDLPLDGGIMTGQISHAGMSSTWRQGRNNAVIAITSSQAYSPLTSIKTENGSWELGAYTTTNNTAYVDRFLITYFSDETYNAASNNNVVSTQLMITKEGSIYPFASTSPTLGTSSYQWNSVYATNFYGNASTATEWANARKVYVALGTASKTTTINGGASDAAAIALGIDGTLGLDHGGTGKTNAKDSANVLLDSLDTWSADPTDDTLLIRHNLTATNKTYGKIAFSTVWNYIKSKADTTYAGIDALAVANALVYKGVIAGVTTSDNNAYGALTPAADCGDTYKVSVAGFINGLRVEIGDMLICTTDNTAAATDSGDTIYTTIRNNWNIIQTSEGSVSTSSTSSTDNAIVRWDGTSGRVIQNSGITIDDNGNLLISHAASATMTASSTNPKITFAENGTQPVHLIYTDYNDYRSPAGLKVIGGTSATPAWFEVEGDTWSAGFKITGKTTSLTDNNLTFSSGGGWCMTDTTWIRTVGSKSVYMNTGTFRNDGTTKLRTLQHINAGIEVDGDWVTGTRGTAPTATTTDGTTTYSGATIGTSILTLGNNKVGANSAAGVAENAKGYLRIYGAGSGYGEFTYNDTMFNSNKSLYFSTSTNSGISNEVRGICATNDYWRVAGGATASNSGYMEIATADDYNEPIYVRQYQGAFTTLKRTATLLDASGNTEFPVQVTAPKFIGALQGNANTATEFSSNATVTLTGDTTGVSDGSKKSWSITTTTSKMTPIDAGSKDLNTLTDLNTAYYYAGGSNTATHGPVTVGAAFGLHMFRTAAGYVRQEFAANGGDKYYRSYGSNAWSDWVKYLSSANYNSYAPTLTGTGASGTWNISITGNATTISAGESTGDYDRPVWFSYQENGTVVNGKLGYNDNFTYNPSTKILNFSAGATISTSDTDTDLTLSGKRYTYLTSGSTMYISNADTTSLVFRRGTTEYARFNSQKGLVIGGPESGVNVNTGISEKLYVNGTSKFLGVLTATAQIKTSFKNSIAIGSYGSSQTTVPNLIAEVKLSSGCMGSANITTAYTLNNVTIPTGWYNFEYIPHRSGGVNGNTNGDNCNYGVLYLHRMNGTEYQDYVISFDASTIKKAYVIGGFKSTITDGQVVISDGTLGAIKTSGYTIAKSVPSDAVFTDHYAWTDITGKPDTYSPTIGTTSTTAMAGNTNVNNVTQGTSTTESWRKIILAGGDAQAAWNTAVVNKTSQVYQAVGIAAQPSTGTLRATVLQGGSLILTGKLLQFAGTKATTTIIECLDNTVDGNGNGIKLIGGGVTVIGSGESAANFSPASAGTEVLYLLSDNQVYIEGNGQTIANRLGLQIDTSGHLLPTKAEGTNNNAQNLGASANRWKNIYGTVLNLNVLTGGSYTAASDKGEGVSPRYFPARWTFNAGITAANGDIITIKIPGAGSGYGDFLSVDNGTHYYPVSHASTSRLTTHFAKDVCITLQFDSAGYASDVFKLNGSDARVASKDDTDVGAGVWRVLSLYDSGNTNDSVYQQNTTGNADYRILLSQNANDTTQTTYARKNTNLKYNPSTQTLKIGSGTLTATNYSGNAATATDATNDSDGNAINSTYFKLTETRAATTSNTFSITKNTDSSSTATGALKVSGGVGIAKKLYVGDEATVKTLSISCTDKVSHITFSRENWNYITYPNHANSALAIGYGTPGDNTNQQLVILKGGTVRPGGNNTQNLGDSTHIWSNVYATTFTGTATNITTTANTTNTMYLVGVKSGATTTLLHDTKITAAGSVLTIDTLTITGGATNASMSSSGTLTIGNATKALTVSTTTAALTISTGNGALEAKSTGTGTVKLTSNSGAMTLSTTSGNMSLSSGGTVSIDSGSNKSLTIGAGSTVSISATTTMTINSTTSTSISATTTMSISGTQGTTINSGSGYATVFKINNTEYGRFNTSGMFQLNDTGTQNTHKLYVNGDSAFNGKIAIGAQTSNTITENVYMQWNTTDQSLDFIFP